VAARIGRGVAIDGALVGLLLLAGVAIHAANLRLEAQAVSLAAPGEVGALPDGRVLRVAALGFERLVADLYWLRTVYYVGDDAVSRAGYPDALRLANLVTDVDPEFASAYVIMTSVLSVLRQRPDEALLLLEKGVRENPEHWRIRFLRGFTRFFDMGDHARAADDMRAAFELGGPKYLQLLAARLYAQGGAPETALAFVEARLAEEGDPRARTRLLARRRDLVIERDLAVIQRALDAWRERGRRAPRDVAGLVRAGLLVTEPRDPEGGAYQIVDGRAVTRLPWTPLEVHRQQRLGAPWRAGS
jgi:tetratricopeptide (TPR) repeat protein